MFDENTSYEKRENIVFEIKANNLLREAEIKTLKLQSEKFDITFFYFGDYAKDMEKNGCGDLANISMHCKSIDGTLELEYARGYIFVSINGYTMLTIDQVEKFKK